MSRIVSQSIAACAAVFLTLVSISTIITVPPAAAFSAMPVLA